MAGYNIPNLLQKRRPDPEQAPKICIFRETPVSIASKVLREAAVFTLKESGRWEKIRRQVSCINLIFTGDAVLRRLNCRFRGVNRLTDVITFRDAESDIFISVNRARVNSRKFQATLREEILRLVVHGALHLAGYTDYVEKERRRMWRLQERILKEGLKKK